MTYQLSPRLINLEGGVLEEPATQYPSVFGNIKFLKDFPYALPTVAIGVIALTTALTSALFLKEVRLVVLLIEYLS